MRVFWPLRQQLLGPELGAVQLVGLDTSHDQRFEDVLALGMMQVQVFDQRIEHLTHVASLHHQQGTFQGFPGGQFSDEVMMDVELLLGKVRVAVALCRLGSEQSQFGVALGGL